MSKVQINNVVVLNNPATFQSPFQFEITFDCMENLEDDLEWKLTYVGSAESSSHDQILDTIYVGPVPEGRHMFVFQADGPDHNKIPPKDVLGVTAVMITCSYHEQEFVRVGYFVHNDYESEELREKQKENPSETPDMSQTITRNIMAEEPRVTRFRINWGDGPALEQPPVEEEGGSLEAGSQEIGGLVVHDTENDFIEDNMDVYLIQETDDSVDIEEVIPTLNDNATEASDTEDNNVVIISGQAGHWRSLLDWAASTCRSYHKLDRKLIMAQDDFMVVTKLLLQTSSRTITGDSEYLLSDLLELQNMIRKFRRTGSQPNADDGVIGAAAKSYQKFLKQSGLVDKWEVIRLCLQCLEENQEKPRFLIHNLHHEEVDLLELITTQVTPVHVVNNSVNTSDKLKMSDLGKDKLKPGNIETVPEQIVLVSSYLRLLLCSKEELSLARAVTTSGLLTNAQFVSVRREAEKTSLPMYQTIVSFVRQMDLGGKSYAPGDGNTLHELLPNLSQFNTIMEKIQTKLEETSGAEAAVIAVISQLKSWLSKNGILITGDMMDTMVQMIQEVARRQTCWKSTPARGRMGRPAIKLLAGLVDLVGCLRLDVNKDDLGKTPARQSKLVASFRTPQPEQMLDPEDDIDNLVEKKSLGDRICHQEIQENVSMTPVSRPAYPRFKSGNDFTEGSPALLRSADRDASICGGRTLMARARGESGDGSPVSSSVENTRKILQEIQEKEEEENKEKVEEVKKQVKKSKRCLNKEVDQIVREKLGLKRKNETDPKSPTKKASKKSKISTPKGQKKLTSFFKR